MSEQDPARLKSSGETPAELVRALQALGRDRDAERLARVAQRLGTSLGTGAATTSWLHGASGAKWLIGLGLGVGAAALIGYALLSTRVPRAPGASPAPRAVETTAKPAVPASTGAAAVRSPQPVTAVAGSAQGPRGAERNSGTRGHEKLRTASVRTATPARRAGAQSASSVAAPPSGAAPMRSAAPEAAALAAPEPEAMPPEPTRERAVTPASPQAKPLPSEVALLHHARRVAADDPERALRVLNDHARRFPSGLLVPERELLVIEVLRRLNRDAEADRRAQSFEARYPHSIHRKRLERAGSGAEK